MAKRKFTNALFLTATSSLPTATSLPPATVATSSTPRTSACSMSVSPAQRPHAHTSLGAPSSTLRSRIPQPSPSRPQRSPSRADNALGIELARSRSASPRPAPLAHASPLVRNRESLVASEDSYGQTVFLNRVPPRTSSLSRPPTRLEAPSSPDDPLFYHPPHQSFPLPHSRSALHQRESMVTQSSSLTTSSLYPPSSSSQTGPDSPPSPSTPSAHSSVDPVHTPGFAVDADDVSYRLRLLVRNNYFLPPAHSKPNHSELSLLSPNVNPLPAKTPSPTFRDLFRVRPRTPSRSGPESPKTTKAPATASPVVRPPVPIRTSTMPALTGSTAPSLREKERRGRVLVIRERLDDLITAANAAEIDMRAREDDRRRREPPNSAPNPAMAAVDLIDPTETVDLPSYMFPVQSSLTPFGGLDAGNSLGAAALADALPPRAEDKEDEAWRKALLHKAVGLSMLSIPEPTPPPSHRSASSSTKSPASAHGTSSSASGSGSKPGSALPSPNPALGRSIISGSRLNNLTPASPHKNSGIRSPGFATRSPNAKTRELPIGSGSSPSSSSPGKSPNASLPPPPRARTASKNSLSPRPSQGAEKPSMLPVPKHTVRRALSTPMLAQKFGTAAASTGAPPLPVQSPGKDRLKPGSSVGQRSVTMSGLRVNTGSGSRAPTPSRSLRATTPISRAGTPSMDRATTPSLPRAVTPSMSRAPTPSPALMLETPDGQTVLPTRDTLASLTSGSNYSDDEEIVAVDDDDEDEIIAVDDDEEDEHMEHEAGREYADGQEEMDDDMRTSSRAGVMLRPDSRMTNATVVRPSFHESRTASRMSNTMSAFGELDSADPERSLSPPGGSSSQRNSFVIPPKRSSTLMSEVVPATPPADWSILPAKSQSPPLNVRRSQVVPPLSLRPPSTYASTIASLRSAPPPASTDFFDTVYTRSLTHGGLGFDSDSEDAEPPVPIFVQPRTRAISTTSTSTSRSKASRILGVDVGSQPTMMHFANSSNPYLAMDPNPYQALDPRKPVTNTPPASQTKFKAMNLLRPATSMGLRSSGRKSPHLIQHPAVRAGMSAESVRTTTSTTGGRAARSEESIATTSTRRQQNPTLTRLDGMYTTHIQAERDRMKRITNAASSSKKS